MPASAPFRSTFLRRVLTSSGRALKRAYRDYPRQPGPGHSRAETLLIRERWFIEGQLDDLSMVVTRDFCHKIAESEKRQDGEPRIYRVISDTLGCVLGTAFGSQAMGKVLTTESLAELLDPERLGERLTLAELWSVPPLVKLVLFERIARNLPGLAAREPNCEWEIRGAIESLHALARVRWPLLIESISSVHRILSEDPSRTYPKMEFQSRDSYRHAVEDLARESEESEEAIARLAISLAQEGVQEEDDPRRSHVGYYLAGPGVAYLRRRGRLAASRATRIGELLRRFPNVPYLGGIAALTAAMTFALYRLLSPLPLWWIALLWIPLSQIAVWIVNFAVSRALPPKVFPRLDFSKGIPREHRTVVVVPTLLLSRPMVERLIERLEVHYLANRDANLLFALLTDFTDSKTPASLDDPLLAYCIRGIRRLNQRYAADGRAPFFLFHRLQRWNESQGAWMGHERKRGKLDEFNRYLLGLADGFAVKTGDLAALRSVKYVITVDTDTLLPRDTAWKLVAAMAHPLQRPVIDTETRTVREGYAILQPRVSTSMESASRSRLAHILSGQTGFDSYTSSISDVYQDLHGRANFTGKGIYDLRAAHTVFDGRFPADTILSHDLIEGEHARVALISDAEMVEDFPATYEGFCQRRHRWVRGDWQLIYWLLPWVPKEGGRWVRNPLSVVSRWKLFDNLRRSLIEISLILMMVLSWLLAPASAAAITIAALAILGVWIYAEFLTSVFQLPPAGYWRTHFRELWGGLRRSSGEAFLTLSFLPHQALLMADAIGRTLVRRLITKRRLLEWVSMAQAESCQRDAFHWIGARVLSGLLLGVGIIAAFAIPAPAIPLALTALWLAAPLTARYANAAPRRIIPERPSEIEFLRDLSLRTWRYFTDFSRSENHWLVPDNVQEEPESIAHRASPTNIGLQLASNIAALDFGYVTHSELAYRLGNLLDTISRMDRYRGHLWNWYDTETLAPAAPRYVSTVDSGNLAAALITVKQACEGVRKQPLAHATLLEGVRDHCVRLRRALPANARQMPAIREMETLPWKIEAHPANLFAWRDVLDEAASLMNDLNERVANVEERLDATDPQRGDEIRYWRAALNQRVRVARHALLESTPWLSAEYRAELTSRTYDPRFEELMGLLSHVPLVGELPETYESVDSAIVQLLDSTEPLARDTAELLERLKEDVSSARDRARELLDTFARQAHTVWSMVDGMDFAFLFNADREQMHIGYNAEKACLDDCYYDLLASEARTAVFLAVAKGDAPRRTWFRLGRKATSFQGHRTLVSWSGTMFEYLMPSIFMKTYEPTLLGRSLAGVVQVQQAYAKQLEIPWGISESSCSSRNQEQVYDYRAFGVPAVSLSQSQEKNVVVAPYASMLALMVDRQPAAENLRWMASQGWTGRYGFFDAVDYQPVSTAQKSATVVRSFMAHHQGMGFLALCNALLENSMQNRFHAEPMVAATEILLQERVPSPFAMAEN